MKVLHLIIIITFLFISRMDGADSVFAKIYLSEDLEIQSTTLLGREVGQNPLMDSLISAGLADRAEFSDGPREWLRKNLVLIQSEGLTSRQVNNYKYTIVGFPKGLIIYRSFFSDNVVPESKPEPKESLNPLLVGFGVIAVLIFVIIYLQQRIISNIAKNNGKERAETSYKNDFNDIRLDLKKLSSDFTSNMNSNFFTSSNSPWFAVIQKSVNGSLDEIKALKQKIDSISENSQSKTTNFTEIKLKEIVSGLDRLTLSFEQLKKKQEELQVKIELRNEDKKIRLDDLQL